MITPTVLACLCLSRDYFSQCESYGVTNTISILWELKLAPMLCDSYYMGYEKGEEITTTRKNKEELDDDWLGWDEYWDEYYNESDPEEEEENLQEQLYSWMALAKEKHDYTESDPEEDLMVWELNH